MTVDPLLPADVAGSLARLLDRDTIIALKLAWARAADAGDPDAMVACFADDATATYDPGQTLSGKASIRAWYAARLGPVVASSHHLSNFEVELPDEDVGTAVLRCYLYSWQRFDAALERPDRHRWARYVDTWRRGPGVGWELKSLRLVAAGEDPEGSPQRVGEYRAEGF